MTGRDDIGLDVVDCSGVAIGVAQMPEPEYVPTEVVAGNTPLPGYPTQADKDGAK